MPSIPEEPEQGELERLSIPDFLRPLQDLEVGLAKEAMLECQVTGLPYPTISWFHNGHRIQSSDDRRMTQCTCLGRDPWDCSLLKLVGFQGPLFSLASLKVCLLWSCQR
jgi:hypothetical protein